jgi:hypothetical protein
MVNKAANDEFNVSNMREAYRKPLKKESVAYPGAIRTMLYFPLHT